MPIEFQCSSCGNTLRVSDENAGRQAKCPVCAAVSTIPQPTGPADVESVRMPETTPNQVDPAVDENPYQPPAHASQMRPHRAGTVLTFGIIAVLCCQLFGIAAWLMANEDLAQMDRGVMDPSGRGTTVAGKVLGIIGIAMLVLTILGNFGMILIGFN